MNKAETKNLSLAGLFFPVLIGLLLTLGLLLFCAFLIITERVPEQAAFYLALGSLFIGGTAASFIASKKAEKSKLLYSFYTAGMLFLCLLLLSFAFMQLPIRLSHFGLVVLSLVLSALSGGMAGAGMKHSRGKQKRKRK